MSSRTAGKCPACGDIITGLNKVCGSCGYVEETAESRASAPDIHQTMEELEQAIATVKAFPKPGITYYFKKMQAAQGASAEMMPGFAFAKKAGRKNAEDFKAIDIGNFEKMLPEVERLQRKVRMYFGDDPKVKLILQELEREVEGKKTEIATAKSLALKVGLGSAVAIVVLYIIMIASSGV